MNFEFQAAKMPYVVFVQESVEDRQASLEAGLVVMKSEDFVYVTPFGSKDRIHRLAVEWLAAKEQDVHEGRFPAEWLAGYKERYKAWKAGQDTPETGTPLALWGQAPAALVATLKNLGIHTVQQLSVCPEDVILRIGLGMRDLVNSAKKYLQAQENASTKMSAMEQEIAELKRQLAEKSDNSAASKAAAASLAELLPAAK